MIVIISIYLTVQILYLHLICQLCVWLWVCDCVCVCVCLWLCMFVRQHFSSTNFCLHHKTICFSHLATAHTFSQSISFRSAELNARMFTVWHFTPTKNNVHCHTNPVCSTLMFYTVTSSTAAFISYATHSGISKDLICSHLHVCTHIKCCVFWMLSMVCWTMGGVCTFVSLYFGRSDSQCSSEVTNKANLSINISFKLLDICFCNLTSVSHASWGFVCKSLAFNEWFMLFFIHIYFKCYILPIILFDL